MLKSTRQGVRNAMLRRDITYRVAIYPTDIKAQRIISFVERCIEAEKLPRSVTNSICIKSSRKLRKGETEIAIRGSLDHRHGASVDFRRVSKLVRKISDAVEKKFFTELQADNTKS